MRAHGLPGADGLLLQGAERIGRLRRAALVAPGYSLSRDLLAIVQCMARHTARGSQDVRAFLARFCERLAALSASDQLLVRSSFRGVDMADLVISQLLGAQGLVGSRVRLNGPALMVRPDAAQTLVMTISELAPNALVFGALSGGEGIVHISWAADKEPEGQVRIV